MSTTSPHELAAAYGSCINEAFRQFTPLIQRWCDQLVKGMYEQSMVAAGIVEKRQLQDAIAVLRKSQSAIDNGFAIELTKAMDPGTGGNNARQTPKSGRSISQLDFDDLELMGDNQIQETVDSARLLQIVSIACETRLVSFSARLSTAQGFGVVKTDKNPLRPEVICSALLKVLQGLPVNNNTRSLWLTHGAQLMGRELESLYWMLDDQLARSGISPAVFAVIQSPNEATANSMVSMEPAPSGRAYGSAEKSGRDALLTLDHLHRLLVGDYDEPFNNNLLPSDFQEGANHGFSHTLPAAMDVLADLKSKGVALNRAGKPRIKPPQSLAQMREQLKTEAKSLGQSLAIEVVGLMIEQMANDARLLPPVREVIANSEAAFLRMGVSDPRFFSDKSHPARRLLEVITAKSLAYSNEDAPGFAEFLFNLRDMATLLTEEHASDAQHFATLLLAFENKLDIGSAASNDAHSRAVQALLQAEQRNLLAEKIADEICARPDFVGGNRFITAFLTGPWAQVMAKERLGEPEGGGIKKAEYSLTLGEVLWSLNLAQTSRHRKRLLKIIPGMVEGLRRGLLSIDYPLADTKVFFDELMRIHQAALRVDVPPFDLEDKARKDIDDTFDARNKAGTKRLWLAPNEAQNSGFMGDIGRDTTPGFEATKPQAPVTSSVELGLGAWVELFSEHKWMRAQLTWISPYNTLFMFTSEGGRTHSMTGPLLQYMLLQELVRVISARGVVEGALNNVARAAMRNSVDGTSTW